ncbi:MAG: hypothetical protein VXW87_02935 [Pseudomonadota bacterium]|nr:hypothetical protein [Pseudomonadota bacterium]
MSKQIIYLSMLSLTSCLIFAGDDNITISVRAGIESVTAHLSPSITNQIGLATTAPIGNLSIDFEKPLSTNFSAGITGTYNYLYLPETHASWPIYRAGVTGQYHISESCKIGLSTSIGHMPLSFLSDSKYVIGYGSDISLGINITNYIYDQVFAQFGFVYGTTPKQSDSLTFFPKDIKGLMFSHSMSIMNISTHAISFTIGYSFDSDSLMNLNSPI